jgi:hypothetical protein
MKYPNVLTAKDFLGLEICAIGKQSSLICPGTHW